jgi:glycosyltransferase involved in cell wall biosynthesis
MKKLSIVIPVYNESATIVAVLDKMKSLDLMDEIEKEIIIVNDCSTDDSGEKITKFIEANTELNYRLHNQTVNQGKGAAIHKGIELATGDYLIMQDADLELDPNDINKLVAAVQLGISKVVYGSRFLEKKHQNTNFVWHILGNNFLTKLSNLFTGFRLTDMMTCYKLVPTELLKNMKLREKRFGFEPEVTLKLAKVKKITLSEVPITYIARTKTDGKKINSGDGMRVIYCILKYAFFN